MLQKGFGFQAHKIYIYQVGDVGMIVGALPHLLKPAQPKKASTRAMSLNCLHAVALLRPRGRSSNNINVCARTHARTHARRVPS